MLVGLKISLDAFGEQFERWLGVHAFERRDKVDQVLLLQQLVVAGSLHPLRSEGSFRSAVLDFAVEELVTFSWVGRVDEQQLVVEQQALLEREVVQAA
jgi:hypothetical protein